MWVIVDIPRATHHNHTYSVCGCGHVFVGTEGGMRGTVGEVREAGNLRRQMVASHSTLKLVF